VGTPLLLDERHVSLEVVVHLEVGTLLVDDFGTIVSSAFSGSRVYAIMLSYRWWLRTCLRFVVCCNIVNNCMPDSRLPVYLRIDYSWVMDVKLQNSKWNGREGKHSSAFMHLSFWLQMLAPLPLVSTPLLVVSNWASSLPIAERPLTATIYS